MITEDKVKLYASFKGDIDSYIRFSAHHACAAVSDSEWAQIHELLASLSLAQRGLASPNFVNEIEKRLAAKTSDEKTRDLMRRLALEGSF